MKQEITVNSTFIRIEQGKKLVEIDRRGDILTEGTITMDMMLQAIELAKKELL